MAHENKLGLTNSADLAREEERISKKKAAELFEKGVKLTKECNSMLDEAQQKINILLKNENDEIVPEKFENKD